MASMTSTADESNGQGWKTWLVGALFTLVLLFGGFSFAGDHERLDKVEALGNINATANAVDKNEIAHLHEQLDRIEAKLDALLMGRSGGK